MREKDARTGGFVLPNYSGHVVVRRLVPAKSQLTPPLLGSPGLLPSRAQFVCDGAQLSDSRGRCAGSTRKSPVLAGGIVARVQPI